jgi:hypothetical protein
VRRWQQSPWDWRAGYDRLPDRWPVHWTLASSGFIADRFGMKSPLLVFAPALAAIGFLLIARLFPECGAASICTSLWFTAQAANPLLSIALPGAQTGWLTWCLLGGALYLWLRSPVEPVRGLPDTRSGLGR